MVPEQRIIPDCPDERCLKHLAWYKRVVLKGDRPSRDPRRARAQLPQTTCDALDKFTCPKRQALIDAMLLRMDVLKGYYSDPKLFDEGKLMVGVAAKPADILPCNFCTANGVTVSRHTIDLKNKHNALAGQHVNNTG